MPYIAKVIKYIILLDMHAQQMRHGWCVNNNVTVFFFLRSFRSQLACKVCKKVFTTQIHILYILNTRNERCYCESTKYCSPLLPKWATKVSWYRVPYVADILMNGTGCRWNDIMSIVIRQSGGKSVCPNNSRGWPFISWNLSLNQTR